MSANIKMQWDQTGEHFYETGVDRGVIYTMNDNGGYNAGEAWNGLIGVDESPSGADSEKIYADNGVYLNLQSAEEFGGTISAYTYPDGFKACNGEKSLTNGVTIGQQSRKSFGFSYRTKKGNEVNPDLGYLIHLWYGCKASPSDKSFTTVNDSPEAIEFSWEVSTTPMDVPAITGVIEAGKTSQLTIDTVEYLGSSTSTGYSDRVGYLETLEEYLYGKPESTAGAADGNDATMLTPAQVYSILTTGSLPS